MIKNFWKFFWFLANFRFFGQKFFFLNSDFSSLVDPYYIHKAFFLKGGPEKTRFLAIRDLLMRLYVLYNMIIIFDHYVTLKLYIIIFL